MNRWLSIILVLAGLSLFWFSGHEHEDLRVKRAVFNDTVASTEGVPPQIVWSTVVMGPFRGLLVDGLWMRASRLQEEGRYFELVQLSDWITKLEPRFAEVWAYQAWNMTYNISVLFNDSPDRWRWVNHGIELLRDRGIPYNPQNAELYWELGWFYQHKIGQDLDNSHLYYKQQLALEMSVLLQGQRRLDYENLANTPDTQEGLRALPDTGKLIALFEEQHLDPFSDALLSPHTADPQALKLIESNEGFGPLHAWIQKTVLKETFKLDYKVMHAVDKEHGPFDWRLPQAHAVYWSYLGLEHAEGFSEVRLKRMIFQAMYRAYQEGWLEIDDETGVVLRSSNLEIIPNVNRAYLLAIAEHPEQTTYPQAHRNFLSDAVFNLFTFSRQKDALKWFNEMHERYPGEDTQNGFDSFLYTTTKGMDKDALSYDEGNTLVEGTLLQSYQARMAGQPKRARGLAALARLYYDQYEKSHPSTPDERHRLALDDFEKIQGRVIERLRKSVKDAQMLKRIQVEAEEAE